METGKDGQFREVQAKVIKFGVADDTYEWLQPKDDEKLHSAATHAQDRPPVSLFVQTGVRTGEVLGLRRQDVHLSADSQMLGCRVTEPHIRARRRAENANSPVAQSRFPRSILVEPELVAL
ncbi:hypothetical protein ACFVZD_43410 [Streptomyces sp. NPDC058287]|uniref:hypothetical protein n=1 Tax=Streptomyces sp. NPDC058287 TaxID=3346423 RepID=UPI0036EBA184